MLEKKVSQEFVEKIFIEMLEKHYQGEYRLEEVARDKNNEYVVEGVYGRTVVEEGTSTVKRLNFYPLNVVKRLQGHRTYKQTLIEDIAKLFIEFVVLHELKHVEQFNGGLTYKKYDKQPYEDNVYEKEANDYALSELNSRDEFTKWLLRLVPWERQFKNFINPENKNREEIEREYEKIKKLNITFLF